MNNIPEKPLVAVGASPASTSDIPLPSDVISTPDIAPGDLEALQTALTALTECQNYAGYSQFAAMRDERDELQSYVESLRESVYTLTDLHSGLEKTVNEATRLCADLPALDDETLAGNIRYLRTLIKEKDLEIGRLEHELHNADLLNEQHRIEYGELAEENKTLRKLVKDFQRVVRDASSVLDVAAADHDPSLWLDAPELDPTQRSSEERWRCATEEEYR